MQCPRCAGQGFEFPELTGNLSGHPERCLRCEGSGTISTSWRWLGSALLLVCAAIAFAIVLMANYEDWQLGEKPIILTLVTILFVFAIVIGMTVAIFSGRS